MAQASVLTDSEIRRVFRIIETTRHANRNRLAFVLSIDAGLRVGEIAALTVGDVLTASGEARREIKLSARQTKGPKGRTVVLSARVRSEIDSYGKAGRGFGCIAAQWACFLVCQPVDAVQGDLRDGGHLNFAAFRTANLCDAVECERRWHADDSEADGGQSISVDGGFVMR